jgi:hypothetical protein
VFESLYQTVVLSRVYLRFVFECVHFFFSFRVVYKCIYSKYRKTQQQKNRRGTQIVDKEANMVLGKATEYKNEKERYAGTIMVPGTHMSLSLLK